MELEVIDRDGKKFVRGFLISTKKAHSPNLYGTWGVSKDTLKEKVEGFRGKGIILNSRSFQDANPHSYADNYQDQMVLQENDTVAKINDLFGPFTYNDGTDDFWYDAEAEIMNEEVGSALAAGKIPIAWSPMIWPIKNGAPIDTPLSFEERLEVKDYLPIHVAFTKEGAFGVQAVVSKMCMGNHGECHKALGGSSLSYSQILSSQLSTQGQVEADTMEEQNLTGNVENKNELPQVDNAPKIDNSAIKINSGQEETKELPAEFTELQNKLNEKDAMLQKLIQKDKERELDTIFNKVDADNKTKLIKKYSKNDNIDELKEFAQDLIEFVMPSLKIKDKALGGTATCGCQNKDPITALGATSGNMITEREVTRKLNAAKTLSVTQMLGGPL